MFGCFIRSVLRCSSQVQFPLLIERLHRENPYPVSLGKLSLRFIVESKITVRGCLFQLFFTRQQIKVTELEGANKIPGWLAWLEGLTLQV